MNRTLVIWAAALVLLVGGTFYAFSQGTLTSPLLNDLGIALSPNEEDQSEDISTATTSDKMIFLDVSETPDTINYGDGDNVLELMGVTSTATELNILDGVTSTTAELNILDTVTSTAAELNILDGVTATAAEINGAADVSSRLVDIGDNTTYTVLVANSGKPHIIPDLTADIVITLPTPAAGLEYSFIYSGVAADAQDWQFDTGSDTNFYLGGLAHLDTDAGSGGDEVVPVAPNGTNESKANVLVPDVSTRVNLVCDGTNWILDGVVVGATAPTYAQQ